MSGSLYLASNIVFKVADGAQLLGSEAWGDYPMMYSRFAGTMGYGHASLLNAGNCTEFKDPHAGSADMCKVCHLRELADMKLPATLTRALIGRRGLKCETSPSLVVASSTAKASSGGRSATPHALMGATRTSAPRCLACYGWTGSRFSRCSSKTRRSGRRTPCSQTMSSYTTCPFSPLQTRATLTVGLGGGRCAHGPC